MIAATGGALFFGGLRRLFRKLSVSSTVWMTVGGVILLNSRPFEGTLTMLPMLTVLLAWLLRDTTNRFSNKFSKVILPGLLVAVIGLSAMGYQYYRVTGNAFTMPYSVHHEQYYPTPLFIFQPINKSAIKGNARIRRIYDTYTSPPILGNLLKIEGLPDSLYLSPFYGIVYLVTALPLFFFSPMLTILLFAVLPLLIWRSRWLLLITVTIVFTFACMCLGIWWDQYHYAAPLTSCFFLLITEGFRQFYVVSKKGTKRRFVFFTLLGLTIGSFIFIQMFSYEQPQMNEDFSNQKTMISEHLVANEPLQVKIPTRATFFKVEFEDVIEKLPNKYIAIVTYNSGYDFHDEIVYNKADIENSKLIWAHNLGSEKNKLLIDYYNDRKVVWIKLLDSQVQINPVP
jgi:hypothetical protein